MREDLEVFDLPELALPTAPAAPPRPKYGSKRKRRTRPRATSLAVKRITRAELAEGARLHPPVDAARPRTRGDCLDAERPCPWVACTHHLYLDVNHETGTIKLNFPDLEPWELQHSCALDVAATGAATLDEVGQLLNITRERVRQIEVRGLLALKMASPSPDEIGAALLHPPPARRRRAPRTGA